MTGPSWLVDSKRIASKIKSASESVDPKRVKWISNPTKACPKCKHIIDNSDVVQEWPGLPHGVKFDPSDQELLGHLLAKIGKENMRAHPFINEFIPTVTEDDGICYTHPEKLPGVRLDGSVSHFFHRTFKAYNTGTRKRRKIQQSVHDENTTLGGDVRWHKTGKTKPVIVNGAHLGCKKIMVLYRSLKKGNKPERTNWVMHQYHLGTGEDEKDGEFVVSKIFYSLKPLDNNKNEVQDDVNVEAVAVHHVVSPTLVTSPQDCTHDNQHLGQASSDQVVDNSIITNDCESAQDPEIGKVEDEDIDNHHDTGEDAKWWEGESQFLLDSQQLAEGIALCDEFLQSQSSCGGEAEQPKRIKPCLLSEYARNGGVDDFKKDLEECQNLSDSFTADDLQPHPTDLELFDTPPDFRLSQLEFGSQDISLS